MKNEVIKSIINQKIIVIVRGIERKKLLPLADSLYKGGIRLLEVTYSADGRISDDEVSENIKLLSETFNGRMLIGSGTVLTKKQVELTYNSGGKYIISPDTYPEVIKRTGELGLVSIPGALTPSEIQTAHRLGADFVKVFPAASVGSEYIKAVKAPLNHIKLLAVGGIDEKNLNEYLKAGICGCGIGSNIIRKKFVDDGNYDAIEALAKAYVNAVKQLS